MHKYLLKYCISLFCIALFNQGLYGQFSFIEEPYNMLQASFLKEKEEIDPAVSFFNVLKIENPTERRLRFDVSFSVPAGWTFMGERTQSILLNPGETRMIPMRASAHVGTLGDIGYSIVAALKDNNGRVFKNIYSFVNVPRKSEIKFRLVDRTVYFDPVLKNAKLSLALSNRGNINELVIVKVKLPATMDILGAQDNFYKEEFILQARRDTIVEIATKLRNTQEAKDLRDHKIGLQVSNKDTTFYATIWGRNLDNKFALEVPIADRILVAEFALLNLFSEYSPVYEGSLWGSLHAAKDLNINYFFRSVGENFYKKDPWRYSSLFIRSNYKRWQIYLGDVSMSNLLSLNGRGGYFSYAGEILSTEGTVSQNIINDINNLGANVNLKLGRNIKLVTGIGIRDKKNDFRETVPTVGTSFSIFKRYSLGVSVGYSLADQILRDTTIEGFGANAFMSASYTKLKISGRAFYGEPTFAGNARGRIDTYGDIIYKVKDNSFITANYTGFQQKIYPLGGQPGEIPQKHNMHQAKILYQTNTSQNLGVGIGAWFDSRGSNTFYGFNPEDWFSSMSTMVNLQLRYRGSNTPINVNSEIRGGVNYITAYSDEYGGAIVENVHSRPRLYPSLYFNTGVRMKIWSLYATYYHGPYTTSQHYAKFYNNINARTIRLIPSLNLLFFKKLFEYTLRGNYAYDISAEMNRLNLSNEITAKPGRGWTIKLSNTLGYQASIDKVSEEKYKYSNMYFEFRVRKEFGFNQPRFKYLNLNIIFFKDLNGNAVRDEDEPGVDNVLVSIDKDYVLSDSLLGTERRGEFYSMELLSNLNGQVSYSNIVDGFYEVRFTPLGKSDNFVTDRSSLRFHLDQSRTIEIPFQEKNKIFGQILMNRSKLSNLGTIDISNIKVTATDTKGKMYSTLTDKNGKFVIYVPNVEKYTVSINNIFREHFELEQNSFDVQLNGYKQFELTYIFTEKQRRINFAQQVSFDAQSQQVQVVRRTNLGGTVKDGTTFAPIKALVKIVDAPTGNVISETVSDGRTGTFYVSYVSGQNYRLDVTADDYWFYSEQLVGEQLSTFMNLNRDITLTAITVGSKLTLKNVTFERNEANLNEEARVELTRMLEVLNANPGIQIQIVGHCDDVEAIDRVGIAEERAKAVMKFLVENGYTNVTHSTSGGTDPVANEVSEEARKLNRRVEAIVISK